MANYFPNYRGSYDDYLCHHGILGMKWGVRRFQNPDGSLTAEGRKRYLREDGSVTKEGHKAFRTKTGKLTSAGEKFYKEEYEKYPKPHPTDFLSKDKKAQDAYFDFIDRQLKIRQKESNPYLREYAVNMFYEVNKHMAKNYIDIYDNIPHTQVAERYIKEQDELLNNSRNMSNAEYFRRSNEIDQRLFSYICKDMGMNDNEKNRERVSKFVMPD